ncbi:MAG: YceI family protein [Planctomycetota bacterium]
MRRIPALLLTLTASVALVAELPAQSQPSYGPGDVNLEHTRAYAFIGKGGLVGHTHAVAGTMSRGRLVLGAPQNAGEFVFDMTSFEADGEAARAYVGLKGGTADWMRKQVNEHMHGTSGLDTKKFPTAVFKIDSATPLATAAQSGKPQYELRGAFTLFGATRPLRIVADAEMINGWVHVTTQFTIKHSDFGRKPYSKAMGAIGIADEVKIWGDAWVAPAATAVAARPAARTLR